MEHLCKISFNTMPIVYYADYISAQKPFFHVDRTADFDVMIYLIKGKMYIIEDGTEYILVPGSIFFLKRGVHHWGEKSCEPDTAWCYVHFKAASGEGETPIENVKYVLLRDAYPQDNSYRKYYELPKILMLETEHSICLNINKYIDYFQSCDLSRLLKANIMFLNILIECHEQSLQNNGTNKVSRHISDIIRYLEQNYKSPFSLDEIGDAIGLNPKYASALFKNETGQNLRDYFSQMKISKAKHLLCETDLTIDYISDSLGFSDQFYFNKVFKKVTGRPPGKYRNEYPPTI